MRLLFVCTGNVVRSPAAEVVMRQIGQGAHETRSAGISPFCLRPVSGEDVRWADVVAVMEDDHGAFIAERWPKAAPKIRVLGIEDRYHRDDPALLAALESRLWGLLADLRVV
ncbi:MAG TPA: phosphotyrosine protein phosphatase [Methylomirabilota bacterium]|nr:phosphotyrosine protein phosphatase [Methylomirabilota bacterium]